jgi:hypothetical protein
VVSANGKARKDYLVSLVELSDSGIIYVKPGAAGNNNGKSWERAFTSLTEACEAAVALPEGMPKELWIAGGAYRLSETGNREAYFRMAPNAKYLGGFGGWESLSSQRSPGANPVTIARDLGGGRLSRNLFATGFDGEGKAIPFPGDLVLEGLRFARAKADRDSAWQWAGDSSAAVT